MTDRDMMEALADIISETPEIWKYKSKDIVQSDLQIIVDKLEPTNKPLPYDQKQIKQCLNEVIKKLNEPEYEPIKDTLDNLSNHLAYNLLNSLTILKDRIQPFVETLTSEIEKEYTKQLVKKGYHYLTKNISKPDINRLVFVKLSDILSNAELAAIPLYYSEYNIKSSDVTYSNTKYVFVKFFNDFNKKFKPISIDNDIIEDIIKGIKEVVSKSKTADIIITENIIHMLIDSKEFNKFFITYKDLLLNNNIKYNLGIVLLEFSKFKKTFDIVVTHLSEYPLPLPESITKDIKDNLKLLSDAITVISLTLYAYLIEKYNINNKLIISKTPDDKYVVNEQTYKKLLKDGYKPENILEFMDIVYESKVIPYWGISINDFKKQYNPDKIQQYKYKILSKADLIKQEALIYAFKKVMIDHITNENQYNEMLNVIPNLDVKNITQDHLLKTLGYYVSRLKRIEDVNDVIYDWYLNTFCRNTIYYLLYTRLNNTYKQYLQEANEGIIDDDIIAKLDLEVLTSMIFDHLKNF